MHYLGDRTRHFHNLTDLAMDALRPDEAMAPSTSRRGARPRFVLPGTVGAGANLAMLQVCLRAPCSRAVLAPEKAQVLLDVPFSCRALCSRAMVSCACRPTQSHNKDGANVYMELRHQ